MILFPELAEALVEQVNVADEITLTLRQPPQRLHALRVEPNLRGSKAGTHGCCMIFHPVGALFTSSCMYAAFFAQRAPVPKRSLPNASRSFAILMPSAPSDCKKPSARLLFVLIPRLQSPVRATAHATAG